MSQRTCSSCGNAVAATARFCPRCGASIEWTPPTAVDPSFNEQNPSAARSTQPYSQSPDPYRPPPPQASYQPYAQQPVYQQPQYMQPAYGPAPAPYYSERKDRTAAILLAIFLGGWTWIYTYKRDSWKFWLTFVLNLTLFNPLWTWILLFLPNFGLHLWAIIDVAVKPQHFYDNFPNG
jgi:hypothetical protein